jgi:hypothetical protein
VKRKWEWKINNVASTICTRHSKLSTRRLERWKRKNKPVERGQSEEREIFVDIETKDEIFRL